MVTLTGAAAEVSGARNLDNKANAPMASRKQPGLKIFMFLLPLIPD
jgi:hypothetical protein